MSEGNHPGEEEQKKKRKKGTRSQVFTFLSSYRACKGNPRKDQSPSHLSLGCRVVAPFFSPSENKKATAI